MATVMIPESGHVAGRCLSWRRGLWSHKAGSTCAIRIMWQESHGAKLYLDQVLAKKEILRA